MDKKMVFKKVLKISGIVLLVLFVGAFSVPYLFKDKIQEKVTKALNDNVDAKITFKNADLSLFSSFPKATISIEKLAVINKAPFEGDTLVAFQELNLKMSVMELFNDANEPMKIEGVASKNGLINIIFNKEGVGNYDIALKNKKQESADKSKPLAFKINNYEVENFKFRFTNEATKIKIELDSINHSGSGDFTNNILDLDTKTTAKVSMRMDKMNYMKNVAVSLDAVLGLDLDKSKYTFKENKAKINDLELEFDGFLQLVSTGQLYDMKFKTPTSSFKNFLGLIPAAYRSNIENVKTSGDFSVVGFAKGLLSETSVPKFNIAIASNNASFQYPDLPNSVKNIIIDTKIINESGVMNDTYVNLDKLSFSIDRDVFNAKATIKNVATNALVDASLKGTINLGNFSKAYPVKLKIPLYGILKADVTTKFDMASVEKSDYQKINNAGSMSLSGFKYVDDAGKVMTISSAKIQFNPSRVNLQEFNATTGKSDVKATGTLDNFYGFVFRNQELKGNFNIASNQIAVSDFMTDATTKTDEKTTKTAMKIPSFLNCTLTAKANTVLYDNLTLKNCSGKLVIKDQAVSLENVKTNVFGGQIDLNGLVSTKEKISKFNMKLGMDQVDITQTFTQLDMFKKIAPIAGVITGKFNSIVKLSGDLNDKEITPNLNTLNGDLLGQMSGTSINPNGSNVLNTISQNLKFIDLKKLNVNDVKMAIAFQDGKVTVKPFDIKYQDIKVSVAGTHSFDQLMNYNLKFDVPAKYLGNEAAGLLAKLSPGEISKLENIPVNANLTGSFSKPKITTDIKSATTSLVTNIAKQQKQKLLSQGTSALENIINNNTKSGDTTKTKKVVNQAKDLLNGLFKKKTP